MRKPTLYGLTLLAMLATGPAASLAADPAAPQSLDETLQQLAVPSGIRFRLAPDLAGDRVAARPAGTAWPEVVRELLRGYNWAGTYDAKGRMAAVSVTGRNGGGAAPQTAAAVPSSELIAYRRKPAKLPAGYKDLLPGSVYPISVPAARLRKMAKGDKIAVSLPDGRYELTRDNVWKHDNGDLTWVGYVDGPQGRFRTLLTLGDKVVDGQIRTPGGLYQLETEDTGDWLIDINASGLQRGALENDGIDPARALLPAPLAIQPGREASAARVTDRMTATLPRNATVNSEGQTVLDLVLLYTGGLAGPHVETQLNSIVSYANQALVDSKASVVLRLVAAKKTGYRNGVLNEDALDDLTYASNGFDNVPRLRQRKGADIVLLVRPFRPASQGGNCGEAWVNGSDGFPLESDLAYGVIGYGRSGGLYCSNYTLAHEVGHILGASHDRPHATVPGRYSYSYGYGIDGQFGDIMSYDDPEIGLYANPDLIACNGQPCGIPADQPRAADVVSTFRKTAGAVSAFRRPAKP